MADLMMVHGLGDHARTMEPFVAAFEDEVDCWTGDLLGHGERPVPPEFFLLATADDLVACMDEAQLKKPFLLGYSFGGRIALNVAHRHPHRVSGICVAGTSFLRSKERIQFGFSWYDPNSDRLRGRLSEHDVALYQTIRDWFGQAMLRPLDLPDDALRAIEVPALIITGTQDPIVTVEESRRLSALLPNNRLVVFEGTMHPQQAVPYGLIAKYMREFIRDVEGVAKEADAPGATGDHRSTNSGPAFQAISNPDFSSIASLA